MQKRQTDRNTDITYETQYWVKAVRKRTEVYSTKPIMKINHTYLKNTTTNSARAPAHPETQFRRHWKMRLLGGEEQGTAMGGRCKWRLKIK